MNLALISDASMGVVVSVLVTLVLSMGGAWAAFGRDVLRKADLTEILSAHAIAPQQAANVCETHCPYLRDERAIGEALERLERGLERLIEAVDRLEKKR